MEQGGEQGLQIYFPIVTGAGRKAIFMTLCHAPALSAWWSDIHVASRHTNYRLSCERGSAPKTHLTVQENVAIKAAYMSLISGTCTSIQPSWEPCVQRSFTFNVQCQTCVTLSFFVVVVDGLTRVALARRSVKALSGPGGVRCACAAKASVSWQLRCCS